MFVDSLSSTETHVVVFRVTEGGLVYALFPFVPATVTNGEGECCVFATDLGFGAAEYNSVIASTRAATPEECWKTQGELMNRGFTLQPYDHDALFGKYASRCPDCFYPSLACHCL